MKTLRTASPCAIAGLLLAASAATAPAIASSDGQITATPERVAIFQDVTSASGVAFTGAQFGAAWGDYDDDGWVDLFVSNHFQDAPNLYHNNGDGTFTDLAGAAGVIPPITARDIHGESWGDYDNDGDLELYLTTNANSPNPFYVFQGGVFQDRAVQARIDDVPGRGRAASWIDYNRDGRLDLFVGNQNSSAGPDKLFKNRGNGLFRDASNASGLNSTRNSGGNVWGDYDGDGDLDLALTGEKIRLYRNNGNGTFIEVATAAGLTKSTANSWGADFGDYDNDGDLDLYIARGGSPYFDHVETTEAKINYYFETTRDLDGINFEHSGNNVTFELGYGDSGSFSLKRIYIGKNGWHPAYTTFTLGATTQHYGKPAFTAGSTVGAFIWQDAPGGAWHLQISNIENSQATIIGDGTIRNVTLTQVESFTTPDRPNRLFQNQGNGKFIEVGAAAGVASPQNSHTATWGDYNNDGWLDLYVVNSGDTAIGNQANQLYRNNGDGTFTDVAGESNIRSQTPSPDDCGIWADYDHNGFLDLFVTNGHVGGYLDGPHKLYRNLGNSNHWLEIRLIGVTVNRHGIGAKVSLLAGGMTQMRQMNNGSHYHCQNDSMLHFGLGNAASVDTLTVTWPNGQTQVLRNVAADRILTVTQNTP